MQDKQINCAQCNKEFIMTVSEQLYYERMGFDEPRRCPECRKHKIRFEADLSSKANRNKRKNFRQENEDGF